MSLRIRHSAFSQQWNPQQQSDEPQEAVAVSPDPPTLEAYYRARYPKHDLAAHIAKTLEFLRGLEPGDIGILNMPPRHGKSDGVQAFIEDTLGKEPESEMMYLAYSSSLAYQRSRSMRNSIRSGAAFRSAYPNVHLASDASKVSEWRLTAGGGLIAAGIGGSLTGKGAKYIIIDDPLKGRKAAESEKQRETVIEAFKADVFTRLEPGGIIIIIQTRWHTDDLAGWVEAQIGAEDLGIDASSVKRLVLPAIAEPTEEMPDPLNRLQGEALWADRWPVSKLSKAARVLGEYDFACLYQQRPFKRGGNVFSDSPARFALEDHTRAGWRITITCDLAASQKRTADYTVFQVWAHQGSGENRRARVLEVRRGQWGIERIAQVAKELQAKYGVVIAIESVAAQIAVVNYVQRLGVKLKLINPSRMGDKFARAQPAAAAWNADRIEVPLEATWEGCTILEYLTEHAQFTGSGSDKHDDIPDTTAYQWLEGEQQALKPSTPGVTGSIAQTNIQGAR